MARRSPEFREIQRHGVLYLHSLDPGQYPSISEVAPAIGVRPLADRFRIGVDVVIEGSEPRFLQRKACRPGQRVRPDCSPPAAAVTVWSWLTHSPGFILVLGIA
ncbi:MAG: hypothetical protein MUQ32_04025 [Chloroflexi bacterium]|nr:hypothetical protein [Chloroflexota bacterium]